MGSIIFDVDRVLNGKLTSDELEQIRQLTKQLTIVLPEVKKLFSISRDLIQRNSTSDELSRGVYAQFAQFIDQYEEFTSGLTRQIDDLIEAQKRTERLLLLEKTGLSQTVEAKKIRQDIQNEHERDYLTTELATQQKLLQTRHKTLSRLNQQAANYGGYEFAPIDLQSRIEVTQLDVEQSKATIEHIKAELRGL